MVRQIERITRTEGERAPWSLLPKGLTYLTHQLMILIDCFVFSAKGAGCNSPAQRAGCAGHLYQALKARNGLPLEENFAMASRAPNRCRAFSAPQTYGNSDPGRWPGLLHPAPSALCSNRTSSGANLMHQVCYRHRKGGQLP